jgi:addiction module RelB/DinJ family antitoxin
MSIINDSIISIRIDKDTKAKAQKVVESIGLDISSAIKASLTKVIQTESIPFNLENKGVLNNPKFILDIKKESLYTKRHGKRFSSTKEMLNDILK